MADHRGRVGQYVLLVDPLLDVGVRRERPELARAGQGPDGQQHPDRHAGQLAQHLAVQAGEALRPWHLRAERDVDQRPAVPAPGVGEPPTGGEDLTEAVDVAGGELRRILELGRHEREQRAREQRQVPAA